MHPCVCVETLPQNVVEPYHEFDLWERSSNACPYLARSFLSHNNLTGSIPAKIGMGNPKNPKLKFLWVQGWSVAVNERGSLSLLDFLALLPFVPDDMEATLHASHKV